jgi:hypothetical protein
MIIPGQAEEGGAERPIIKRTPVEIRDLASGIGMCFSPQKRSNAIKLYISTNKRTMRSDFCETPRFL